MSRMPHYPSMNYFLCKNTKLFFTQLKTKQKSNHRKVKYRRQILSLFFGISKNCEHPLNKRRPTLHFLTCIGEVMENFCWGPTFVQHFKINFMLLILPSSFENNSGRPAFYNLHCLLILVSFSFVKLKILIKKCRRCLMTSHAQFFKTSFLM